MKVIVNEKKLKRNKTLGQAALIGGFVGMGIGIFLIIRDTYSAGTTGFTSNWGWLLGVYVLGFILSQTGIYFMNRTRAAAEVTKSLKGMPGNYVLYHGVAPVSHLLVGPAGVWIIEYFYQRGRVVYEKNKWRMSGGGLGAAYQRIFGQEGLGRPDLDAEADIATLKKFFVKQFGEAELPPIHAALVFYHADAEVDAPDAPFPTMPAKHLKGFIRSHAREHPFPAAEIERIAALFPTVGKQEEADK